MPTFIVIDEKFKVELRANDHGIPHVHVTFRGQELRIEIRTLRITARKGFRNVKDIKLVLKTVEKYADDLLALWEKYNG